jgi:signal peptidase II
MPDPIPTHATTSPDSIAPGGPGTPRSRSDRVLPLFLALAVLIADQWSKSWVLSHLEPGRLYSFLPGLLALQRVSNTGAAFSLFRDSAQILAVVSLAVSAAVLLWILWKPPHSLWPRLALGFLLGGAAGNGLDRWNHGAVTDFLATVPFSFPVFNLADVAINLAVACFALNQLAAFLPRRTGPSSPRSRGRQGSGRGAGPGGSHG